MTKVELYKSRVFVTIIHLCALGQFAYGLYYSSFEIQRSYKLKTSLSRRLVPDTLPQKFRLLSYWSLLSLLLLILHCALATKWFIGSASFDHSSAWLDDYLPCARDIVVFPTNFPAVLPLPSAVSITGFIFPDQGALLLSQDGVISLGSNDYTRDCNTDRKLAHLKPPKTSKWYDPSSWLNVYENNVAAPNRRDMAAIPELERVPCNNEHVVITANNGALSFDLEQVPFLRLGQLSLAGSSISKPYLQQLLGTELGQLLFHNADGAKVEYYRNSACGCMRDFNRFVEPVCHNVESTCERPHCASAVVPFGACCGICGAVLRVPTVNCMESDRKVLETLVNDQLKREDLEDELLAHVNYVGSEQFGNFLQAVVVDRETYKERSVEFMKRLVEGRNRSTLLTGQSKLELRYAGRPYNPNVSFGSVLLIMLCLLLVIAVAVIMLAHFMPHNQHLNRIPQWIHDPRRWRWPDWRLRSNLLFARFDNAAGVQVGGNSGVEHVAEPIMGYDAQHDEVRERAFNNPMFEEVATPQSPPQSPPQLSPPSLAHSLPSPHVEVGDLDSCSVEEQELTEINLESSESESDGEAETVK